MQITINQVSTEFTKTAKGGWNKAVVSYTDQNGASKNQNIIDFANRQVYGVVTQAKPGDTFEVVTRQNDKGYSEWASITPATASIGTPVPTATAKAPTSNYETREERAVRQRLIVRQSSLTAALGTLSPGSKGPINPDEVEKLAERYNAWVFQAPSMFEEENDIPF